MFNFCKLTLFYVFSFLIFCPSYDFSGFFSPFVVKKGVKVVCQDNLNRIPNIVRGGQLRCDSNSTIIINSASLEISSEKNCALHYRGNPTPPQCDHLIENNVLVYLSKICDSKYECSFSFATDLPQLRCLSSTNELNLIDNRFSAVRINYTCRPLRISFWPFRRNKQRRKRVNVKTFRKLKKLRKEQKVLPLEPVKI